MNLDDLPEFPDPANTKAMREFAVREEQLGYHYLNTDQSRAIVHFCRACITTENKKALTHQLYLDLTQEQAILLMDSLPEMEKKRLETLSNQPKEI
uniref:Uncharacterized protein n=1 Tax=Ditylenchus dipsaci TaxID=166011 RepID=A0A915EC06_9BILA